ncbi:MAG TPA: hypothetical protein VM537_12325 [Anaerolineae bacterium]|nr:hypothetical protein [Anaerolineae bacterium]
MKVRFIRNQTVNGQVFDEGQEVDLFDALAHRLYGEGAVEPADSAAKTQLEANRPGRPLRQTRRRALNWQTGEWEWRE